jgi:plastocyanin
VTGATAVTFSHVAQIQGATQIAVSGSVTGPDSVLSTVQLSAIVRDQNNAPVQGVVVTWSLTAGAGTLSHPTSTSNASGIAIDSLTVTQVSGDRTVQAAVTGLIGSPVTFTHSAKAGNAVSMTLNDGNNQVGPVSTALPTPHSVIVRDFYNNPKSNFSVTWSVGLGGGSINPSGAATTNGSGIASVTRTLGPSTGVHTDTASGIGLDSVVFTDTAAALIGIQVNNNVFNPANDTVATGAFVVFTWAGGVQHNVTWDLVPSGAAPPNSTTQSSGSFTTRLTITGTYTYYCTIHGSPGAGMHGQIVTQ